MGTFYFFSCGPAHPTGDDVMNPGATAILKVTKPTAAKTYLNLEIQAAKPSLPVSLKQKIGGQVLS